MSTTTSITGAVWDGTRALGTATLAWSGDSIASVEPADGPSGGFFHLGESLPW